MPRRPNILPTYTLHKPSNQARCRVRGHDCYLGEYGSRQSLERYLALLAEIIRRKPVDADGDDEQR